MASSSAQTEADPVQVKLADGSFFVCSCGGTDLRITVPNDSGLHWFCRCGQVYVASDFPPLWEG